MRKGTIFYSLYPGKPPNFAIMNHTLTNAKGDAKLYHLLTQVQSDNFAPGYLLRTKLRVYRLLEDICVAKGRALANTQFGQGGATQYFISAQDIGKMKAGKIRPI